MTRGCIPTAKKDKGKNELTLAILGLDNAGKTTTTKCFQGESQDSVTPTMGFEKAEFSLEGFNVVMYDLGGGRTIRDIWKEYFSAVYGIVYVVDSTDLHRLGECKTVIRKLLSDPLVKGKPILLLANKQDEDHALDESEILEELQIEDIVNDNKCPCRVELVSARFGVGKSMDPALKQGLLWLLTYINANMDTLEPRVSADMDADRAFQENKRSQRRQKVSHIREQNERERRARGEISDEDDDPLARPGASNPFRRLDTKELDEKSRLERERSARNPLHRSSDNLTSSYDMPSRSQQSQRPAPFSSSTSTSRPLGSIGSSSAARGSSLTSSHQQPNSVTRAGVRTDDFNSRSTFNRDPYDDSYRRPMDDSMRRSPSTPTGHQSWKRDPFVTDDLGASSSLGPRSQLKPLGGSSRPMSGNSDDDRFTSRASAQRPSAVTGVRRNQLAPYDDFDSRPVGGSSRGGGDATRNKGNRFDMFVV